MTERSWTPVSLAWNAWTSARMPWESMKLISARSMITLRSLANRLDRAQQSRGSGEIQLAVHVDDDLGNAIDATDVPSRAAIAAPSVVSLRAVKVTEPPGGDLLGDEALSPPEASH